MDAREVAGVLLRGGQLILNRQTANLQQPLKLAAPRDLGRTRESPHDANVLTTPTRATTITTSTAITAARRRGPRILASQDRRA
jgi:hypothetical protein